MKKKLLTISLLTLAIVCLAKNPQLHSQTTESLMLKKAKQSRLDEAVKEERRKFDVVRDSLCIYNEKQDSLYRVELELLAKKKALDDKTKVAAKKSLVVMRLAELKSHKVPPIIIINQPKREVVLPSFVRPSIKTDSTQQHIRRTFWDRIFFRNR